MALQNAIALDSGINVPSAYHKIVSVDIFLGVAGVVNSRVVVVSSVNRARSNIGNAFLTRNFEITFANDTYNISTAYNALKLLPEFLGAADV